MANDPKDKELTGKQADKVQAGRTQDAGGQDQPNYAVRSKTHEIDEEGLKDVSAGRTQPPKRE